LLQEIRNDIGGHFGHEAALNAISMLQPDACGSIARPLVRIVGQAPLAATVYNLEELRCNACGQVFTAPEPEGVGPEKYDETALAMVAELKYGSGMPFNRIENLEERLGVPLPAATQWGMVAEAADLLHPVQEELIRAAAQGELFHNDDTSVRILHAGAAGER
jgi:transposase